MGYIGDMYNDNGEEYYAVGFVPMFETRNDNDLGFRLYAAGITDQREPYLIMEQMRRENHEWEHDIARISLREPRYIQCDRKLNRYHLEKMIEILHNQWDQVVLCCEISFIEHQNFPDAVPTSCPDYSNLETEEYEGYNHSITEVEAGII